mgnify:FL=1
MDKQSVVELLKKTIQAIEQDDDYQGSVRYYLHDDNEYHVSVTLPDMLTLPHTQIGATLNPNGKTLN